MRRLIVVVAGILLVLALGGSAADSKRGAQRVAQHIWDLEDQYINGNLDGDHPAILELLHERFLGWPGGEPTPAGRESMAAYLDRRYSKPATWTITIERRGIEVLDDMAVNHYTVHARWQDVAGVEHRQSSRVTLTWVREGSRWLILGGMSAPLEPPPSAGEGSS